MTDQHNTMATETSAFERVERARAEPMALSVIRTEPYIVQVENEESGRIHTVVPDAPHCSCEDHTYRNTVCKHMIRVLEDGGEAAVVLEEALEDREQNLQERLTELQEQVNQTQSEADSIRAVLSETDRDWPGTVIDTEHADSVTVDEVEQLTTDLIDN